MCLDSGSKRLIELNLICHPKLRFTHSLRFKILTLQITLNSHCDAVFIDAYAWYVMNGGGGNDVQVNVLGECPGKMDRGITREKCLMPCMAAQLISRDNHNIVSK